MPVSRLLVLALSLSAGGGAAYLTTTGEPQVQEVTVTAPAARPGERVEVLVAATDLAQRSRLSPEHLSWKPWPKDSLRDDYITKTSDPGAIEAFDGTMVRVSLMEGDPVRRSKISADAGGYLSALLEPGKRAVSVKVTAESTAGGFILPEDRVDVLHTIIPQGAGGGATRTIVTNVRVLAVDQQITPPEANAVASAKTATLELEPRQAEVVSAAEAQGTLSLALRSSADNSETQQLVARDMQRTVTIIGRGQGRVAKTN